MKVGISYTLGSDCTSGECMINLLPKTETRFSRRLLSDNSHYYLLVDGSVKIKYENSDALEISTPYQSNEWTNYINTWNSNEDVVITVKPNTKFLQIVSNNVSKIETVNVSSGIVSKSMAAGSTLYVFSDDFTLNCEAGETHHVANSTFKFHTHLTLTSDVVTLNSNSKMVAVYVEKA